MASLEYQREWRKKNLEHVREYGRRWRKKNLEKERKSDRQWYEKNREKKREYHRQWYKKNPEKVRERKRQWRKKNPEKGREYCRGWNRRFRLRIIEHLGGKCNRCGITDVRVLQIDHINGGGRRELRSLSRHQYYHLVFSDTIGKYQLLCANCNWIKKYESNENPNKAERERNMPIVNPINPIKPTPKG